jgi:hypothetical protein
MEDTAFKKCRFGFVGYTDHDGDAALTVCKRLTTQRSRISAFIQKLIPKGGGDYPEAVLDGLHEAVLMPWRGGCTKKLIILLCDAPPHGLQYGGGGDAHPEGCPCGLTETKVLGEIKRQNIQLAVVNITSEEALAPMIRIFHQLLPQMIASRANKHDMMEQLETLLKTN